MNKLIILGLAATFGVANMAVKMMAADPPVNLQATSPGTAQSGHLNITGTATVGLLKSQGTVFGASTAPTGFAYGGFFTAASNQGRGFYGFASSTTGLTYGGFFQNASESGRAVYGLATATTGFNYGGYFQTASDSGRGLLGVAASPTGTTYGVYGTSASPDGYGVYSDGKMHATGVISGNGSGLTNVDAAKFGGKFASGYYSVGNAISVAGDFYTAVTAVSNVVAGRGIYARADDNTTATHGVWAEVSSPTGRGVLGYAYSSTGINRGVYGRSDSNEGTGVWGLANAATGNTRGVYAEAISPSGVAVHGNSAATTGLSRAFFGTSASPDAWVAEFRATASAGFPYALLASNYSSDGYALFAQATALTGTPIAIYGRVDVSNGVGLQTNGRLVASGTKSFQIDHPHDPTNKYLTHYCTESPSPQNSYSGNVVTDARGYAWVVLPDYFEDINTNFKYQLTVVDDGDSAGFVMAKVSRAIRGNQFQVRTNEPRATVSWRIEADRNDRYVQANPQRDVSEKGPRERGTYVQPELYGRPKSEGESYLPSNEREMAAERAKDRPINHKPIR